MRDLNTEWLQFGRHRYRIFEDVLVYEPHGAMSIEETRQLMAKTHEIYERFGMIFCIVDASDAAPSEAPVRKFISDEGKRRNTNGTTYLFGANLIIRSFAILWQNMARLMGRTRSKLFFVHTEEEAWSEIDKERADLKARSASG